MSASDFTIDTMSSSDPSKSDVRYIPRPLSVKVTDYSYNHINPSPVKIPKGCELLEEFLSPRKLQALTGVDDLETVEYLEMRVNTEQMSLGNFGMYLPNLSQIKLSGSFIPSIRDLGTSLYNLQVLWMPQCSLMCLDGLVTMSNLRELYLAYNQIEDISSCGMLENLEILDLEGNLIEDLTNIHYLSICPTLCRLTLEGNPLCNPDNYSLPHTYRSSVFDILPQLQFLDDLAPHSKRKVAAGDTGQLSRDIIDNSNATLEFEDHWNFINTVLVESGLLAESEKSRQQSESSFVGEMSPRDSGRPSSSSYVVSSRPSTSMRPLSAVQRPLTMSGLARPLSSSSSTNLRPGTSATIDSGNVMVDAGEDQTTEDSTLTAGKIVCGSITKSLRRRTDHTEQKSPRTSINTEEITSRVPMSGRRCADTQSPMMRQETSAEDTCDIVLKELDEWRRDYERSKTRIEQQRAPQVLTIDYSEDDIEEVDLPKLEKRNEESIKGSRKGKEKPEIKLNPIRNGKCPPESRLPSSWVPRDQRVSKCVEPVLGPVTPPSTASHQGPQMTRIRRQLMQSGVATMMPSRPLIKK